jgi:hypothetical protein
MFMGAEYSGKPTVCTAKPQPRGGIAAGLTTAGNNAIANGNLVVKQNRRSRINIFSSRS